MKADYVRGYMAGYMTKLAVKDETGMPMSMETAKSILAAPGGFSEADQAAAKKIAGKNKLPPAQQKSSKPDAVTPMTEAKTGVNPGPDYTQGEEVGQIDMNKLSPRDQQMLALGVEHGNAQGLGTSAKYLGTSAGGALVGGGIGAAVAPEGKRGTYGLYGALGGAAIAPTALYLAERIAAKSKVG